MRGSAVHLCVLGGRRVGHGRRFGERAALAGVRVMRKGLRVVAGGVYRGLLDVGAGRGKVTLELWLLIRLLLLVVLLLLLVRMRVRVRLLAAVDICSGCVCRQSWSRNVLRRLRR